jgi:hypothetical protein
VRDYKHKKKRLANITPLTFPIIGSEFEMDGHIFLISDVKIKEENGNHVAVCSVESALITFSITFCSKLPLFKMGE